MVNDCNVLKLNSILKKTSRRKLEKLSTIAHSNYDSYLLVKAISNGTFRNIQKEVLEYLKTEQDKTSHRYAKEAFQEAINAMRAA